MNENKNTSNEPNLPKGIPLELVPVYDWWMKDGKKVVTYLLVAAVAVGGYLYYKQATKARDNSASNALASAVTAEDYEDAIAKYGSAKSADAIKVAYAKSLFDAGKYEEALAEYEKLGASVDGASALSEIVKIGKAFSLEALRRNDEAQKAYEDFVADQGNAKSAFLLTAKIGAARVKALKGDKAAAIASLESLTNGLEYAEKASVETAIEAVKHVDPKRLETLLMDQFNEVEKAVATNAAPAKPASPAPAQVAKPAAPAKAEK